MVCISKSLRLAVLGVVLLVSVPSYAEEIFSGTQFLTWPKDQQRFYIHTSVGIANLIVGQTSKTQGKCIEDWYAGNENIAVDYVLEVVRKNPEYHPRGTILAIMEKKCGQFSYREK
jgi:hypothetical protein